MDGKAWWLNRRTTTSKTSRMVVKWYAVLGQDAENSNRSSNAQSERLLSTGWFCEQPLCNDSSYGQSVMLRGYDILEGWVFKLTSQHLTRIIAIKTLNRRYSKRVKCLLPGLFEVRANLLMKGACFPRKAHYLKLGYLAGQERPLSAIARQCSALSREVSSNFLLCQGHPIHVLAPH
jgi:hypothetical protein